MKRILKFLKKAWRYSQIDVIAKTTLIQRFRDYEETKSKAILKSLVEIVDFCNQIGINGETEDIKRKVKEEWDRLNG